MKKLSKIKILIKKNKKWKEYKNKFQHKQMKLIFSKISLEFDKNIDIKFLIHEEISLISKKKEIKMFEIAFQNLSKIIKFKCDWKIFAKFLWYIYQTSSYWNDSKKDIENIFNRNNFLEINLQKRTFFEEWLKSIDKKQKNFNKYIQAIAKLVF